MKKFLLSVAVAALFSMPSAQAGDNVSGYGYVGLDAGLATVKDVAQQEATRYVNIAGGSARVNQAISAEVGRIFAGYTINKTFAVELGYFKTGDYKTTLSGVTSGNVAYSQTVITSTSGVDYSVVIKPIETKGWDGLFAKVGGHTTETKGTFTATNMTVSSGTISKKGSGYLVGVGYELPIADTINARAAYTYYNNVGGESDNSSNVFTVGVLAKF